MKNKGKILNILYHFIYKYCWWKICFIRLSSNDFLNILVSVYNFKLFLHQFTKSTFTEEILLANHIQWTWLQYFAGIIHCLLNGQHKDLREMPRMCIYDLCTQRNLKEISPLHTSSRNTQVNHALKLSGSGKCSPKSSS